MRFNKQELFDFACNPETKFDKEGLLYITEQERSGYIFRTSVKYLRWCKLRGNLLFYLKTESCFSKPVGLIVIENCKPVIRSNEEEPDGYPISLEFENSETLRILAISNAERLDWYTFLQRPSCAELNLRIELLNSKIATAMGNRIEKGTPVAKPQEKTTTNIEEDLVEIPICESALSCDSLASGENGRFPNALITVQIRNGIDCCWRQYARTEVVESTSNPQFLCTVCFRASDHLNSESLVRFTLYNVIEKVSQTTIPIGFAEISLGVIQDATRFRIPLKSAGGDVGFITIASWAPDPDVRPPRSPAKLADQQFKGHRRSQSLPSKLGVKLFIPNQEKLFEVFTNPRIHTYRLHSGLGGDISVQEVLMESRYCFIIPQQLLSIWIMREKELLQEISGMGELGGEWRRRQIELLDKHLKLLKDYSQAKQVLQQKTEKENGPYFKQSSVKTDESLEFIPVNLHLQRMWAHNDSLNRTGVLDVVTVGAFTRHAGKQRTGGLIKLLQQIRDSPSKFDDNECKVQTANNAVQAVKQLRREIVEIMSQLLCLAKSKNPKGMMSLCNEMISKTKTLLNIWEPRLVEEAFSFIEQHRIIEEPDNMMMPMSPFKKITQQLSALDLKSPELEDFATPVVAPPDLWPKSQRNSNNSRQFGCSNTMRMKSPSLTDINAIFSIQKSMKIYSDQLCARESEEEHTHQSLPASVNFESDMNFQDYHFDDRLRSGQLLDDMLTDLGAGCSYSQNSTYNFDGESLLPPSCSAIISQSVGFLDTKMMSTSPSANYYRPTEEPEPLDLTQLNIEASVMCLVSKIKFLCGRCGSPAIRLRHPKDVASKGGGSSTPAPDVVANQSQFPQENNVSDEAMCSGNDLDLEIAQNLKAEVEVEARLKKGNKFTDGLDLSMTTDWVSELRPSMRKLRTAMDGLLKTARLMHSVQRLQQDIKRNSANLDILYRRDVCFSQSLTALISALMAKLWGTNITENYIKLLTDLGPIAYFEGLLSLYGGETDMWSDMSVAIEDLLTVRFTLIRSNIQSGATVTTQPEPRDLQLSTTPVCVSSAGIEGMPLMIFSAENCTCRLSTCSQEVVEGTRPWFFTSCQQDSSSVPMPRVSGVRNALNVTLPVPESVYSILPTREMVTFKVTPVFFNIGINEKATLAEAIGCNRDQHRSNWDNFERLKQYHISYRKLSLNSPDTPTKSEPYLPTQAATNFLFLMEEQLRSNVSKNMKILHLAEDICRSMSGLRFSSCKSAKDRTGMAVTLEQCRLLVQEFHLPAKSVPNVLSAMRSEGTRMDNVKKNIGKRKYAFNLPQVYSLPAMYRPPLGSYGKAQT